ncbi:MAG: hypothetical protein AABP62_21855 [Planctomycetota bacterium]
MNWNINWNLLSSYWALVLGLVVWFLLSFGAAFLYQYLSRFDWTKSVLAWGISVTRQRYGLLMCIAPAVLGIVAWRNPNMLQALLLAREDNACWDIFTITLISYFTVGVGLAQCRLVVLNGDARCIKVEPLSSTEAQPSVPSAGTAATAATNVTSSTVGQSEVAPGWSPRRFVWWYVLGLLFPLIVLVMTLKEGSNQTSELFKGVFAGFVVVNLFALIVACLADWVLGQINQTAHAGILPFEKWADRIGGRFGRTSASASQSPAKGIAGWFFGNPKRGFSWLLHGPGYTDAKGILLPGQPQALILVGISTLIYFGGYFWGLSDDTWSSLQWPTGFCAVLLLFLIGYFMSGLAFWLDRYGLPPVIFAMVYTVAVFYLGVTDHYFEIDNIRPVAISTDEKIQKIRGEVPAEERERNAYVAAATRPLSEEEKKDDQHYEQLYWAEVLKDWPFPVGPDGKKTLVVVTASGGGIQAAAWTTKVLTELDHEFPGLSQSIGLMSTVSGGSVGAMFYLGHRGLLDPAARDHESMLRHETEDKKGEVKKPSSKVIIGHSMKSALEGVAWGLAGPDFVRIVIPMAAPPLIDRGWALESLWWNQMGRGLQDRKLMGAVTIRDLIPLTREHRIPPVIFNATCVETGQRVQISPLRVAVAKADEKRQQEHVDTPIDFLDFYDAALSGPNGTAKESWGRSNLRVSTAVRLSATFSYVTPVTRPHPTQGFGPGATLQRIGLWKKDAGKSMMNEADTEQERRLKRLNRHFCDGGYADNPGLVTAVKSLKDLLHFYSQKDAPKPPFDRVLVIRIEPFPKTAAQHAKDNTGFQSAVFGPSAAVNAMRVSTQAERGNLELELLERSRYAKRRATSPYLQAVDVLQTVQKRLPESDAATIPLRGIIEQAKLPMETGNNESSEQGKQTFLPQAKSLETMIGDVAKLKLEIPEGLKNQLGSAQELLNQAQEAATGIRDIPDDDNIVPIDSVTFRFEVHHGDRDPTLETRDPLKFKELVEPPLTWTLTEKQKADIDLAWVRMKLEKNWNNYFDSTADTISPKAIEQMFFSKVKTP